MQRYSDTVTLIQRDGKKRSYETMYYPEFPYLPSDIYIITKKLDRMDLLAYEHYGDPRLWWVIQRSNTGLPYGTMVLPAGRRIRIPSTYTANEIYDLMIAKQF